MSHAKRDFSNEPIDVSRLKTSYVPRYRQAMATLEEARDIVKDLKTEMKSAGYDPKLADQAYKVRRKQNGREEYIKTRDLLDIYVDAFEDVSEMESAY